MPTSSKLAAWHMERVGNVVHVCRTRSPNRVQSTAGLKQFTDQLHQMVVGQCNQYLGLAGVQQGLHQLAQTNLLALLVGVEQDGADRVQVVAGHQVLREQGCVHFGLKYDGKILFFNRLKKLIYYFLNYLKK